MKLVVATAAVVSAIGVSAQGSGTASITATPSTSYVYSYYDDCLTETSGGSMETNTVVQTYCHECEEESSASSASAASAFRAAGGVMTTYTTVFSDLCSTGIAQKTYTVTESCSSSVHGQPRSADYVPQGFTVTTATCHVCGPEPVVATLTTPIPAPTAPASAPAAKTAAGNSPSGGSPGGPSAASPAAGSTPETQGSTSGGSAPGGSAPGSSSPGSSSPGSSSPEGSSLPGSPASPGSAGGAVPAPGRYAAVPTGAAGPGSSGNASAPFTPFTGAASSISVGLALALGSAGVWALAYAL